jgi:metal-responsive CopG/Arc/MetJ family transcriptional regulator
MRDVKFQMMLSPTEVEEIDEYRWKNRVDSRAEAIRQLVAKGLDKTKSAEVKHTEAV